jgi:hypothetical protein
VWLQELNEVIAKVNEQLATSGAAFITHEDFVTIGLGTVPILSLSLFIYYSSPLHLCLHLRGVCLF